MRPGLERQRHFLSFTLSSLARRKGRNASLVLVYSLVIFTIASVMFFAQALRSEAEATLQDTPEMILQRTLAGRHDLIPEEYARKVREIRGVAGVEARLWGYYYHRAAGANYTVMAQRDFELPDDEAMVGAGVKRTWRTADGDTLLFKTFEGGSVALKATHILDADTELVSSDLVLVSEPTFRRIMGIPASLATDLVVRVPNRSEQQTVVEKIIREMPDVRPILRDEILRTYSSLFDWRSGFIIVSLGGGVLAFFIFAWDKGTGLSAEEKGEIGILKALGWDTADILAMKFWEGAVVSMTSFLLGVLLAYGHVFFASGALFEHALKGWAVLYPRFSLHPTIDFYALATVFFLAVVPYTLITVVPIWRVATTDPDAVMRQV